jgi:hypothetical protein
MNKRRFFLVVFGGDDSIYRNHNQKRVECCWNINRRDSISKRVCRGLKKHADLVGIDFEYKDTHFQQKREKSHFEVKISLTLLQMNTFSTGGRLNGGSDVRIEVPMTSVSFLFYNFTYHSGYCFLKIAAREFIVFLK